MRGVPSFQRCRRPVLRLRLSLPAAPRYLGPGSRVGVSIYSFVLVKQANLGFTWSASSGPQSTAATLASDERTPISAHLKSSKSGIRRQCLYFCTGSQRTATTLAIDQRTPNVAHLKSSKSGIRRQFFYICTSALGRQALLQHERATLVVPLIQPT